MSDDMRPDVASGSAATIGELNDGTPPPDTSTVAVTNSSEPMIDFI